MTSATVTEFTSTVKKNGLLFKLGEDSEYVVCDPARNMRPVSAIPLFPGSKGKPVALPCGLGGVIHDGVLCESNMNPAESEAEWVGNNISVMNDIDNYLGDKGLVLNLMGSAEFPDDELKHPEARVSGCSEDLDAWAVKVNAAPALGITNLRSAGGHIHIGFGNNNDFNTLLHEDHGKIILTRILDIFVGLPSVFMDKLPGTKERRKLYGRAGAFRRKDYGLEYRVLSPWWKQNTRTLSLLYKLVKGACVEFVDNMEFRKVEDLSNYEKAWPVFKEIFPPQSGRHQELIRIINDCDREAAVMFFTEFVTPFMKNSLVFDVMEQMEAPSHE